MQNSPHQNTPMQLSLISSKSAKCTLAAAASLMLAFVFTGCTAAGPLQSHSAFKQSALPSGYQSVYQGQPSFAAQQAAPQFSQGSGARGFGGGRLDPFAGGGNFGTASFGGGGGFSSGGGSGSC